MNRAPVVLLLALAVVPRDGWTQGGVPIGPEFRINTYTASSQEDPSVAADPEARFVVVWKSNGQDGSGSGVFGQRYFITGFPQGPEFRVNTSTTDDQSGPSAAMWGGGNFVVVWTSIPDGSSAGIFGQRFLSGGAPAGPEFRVNTYTTYPQDMAAVAADIFGNFVVVWTSFGQDGHLRGVFGQRYASSGVPLGPEFQVNTYTTGYQYRPVVASDSQGNFVVVWQDGTIVGGGGGLPGLGIFGQRYDSSGAPAGPQFQVETYTTGFQGYPSVGMDASGDFVVVWNSDGPDGSSWGIYGQRYSGSGVPAGSEFRVNTHTTGYQFWPAAVSDGAGNFVVTWTSDGQDGALSGIYGQRYDNAGIPQGSEFRVNTYTPGAQARPAVATNGGGNFVVMWQSQSQDGNAYGIFGQRYDQIVPVELMRFGVE